MYSKHAHWSADAESEVQRKVLSWLEGLLEVVGFEAMVESGSVVHIQRVGYLYCLSPG